MSHFRITTKFNGAFLSYRSYKGWNLAHRFWWRAIRLWGERWLFIEWRFGP